LVPSKRQGSPQGVAACEHALARLVVVDAIDDKAAGLERRLGFIPSPDCDLRPPSE
jgi:hypothetical protein